MSNHPVVLCCSVGALLLFVGIALLAWNEARVVRTAQSLAEGLDKVRLASYWMPCTSLCYCCCTRCMHAWVQLGHGWALMGVVRAPRVCVCAILCRCRLLRLRTTVCCLATKARYVGHVLVVSGRRATPL